jgi:hypothetical protein
MPLTGNARSFDPQKSSAALTDHVPAASDLPRDRAEQSRKESLQCSPHWRPTI